jgi:hypothetical protein
MKTLASALAIVVGIGLIESRSVVLARDRIVAEIPANVVIPGIYRPTVEAMLQQSPTFRRQCQRIAADPQLQVAITIPHQWKPHLARAMTHFTIRGNQLIATVELFPPGDEIELIAHEFEHVIEQIDGIDLAAQASLPDTGVHAVVTEGLLFETIRAARTGVRVAQEVRTATTGRSN